MSNQTRVRASHPQHTTAIKHEDIENVTGELTMVSLIANRLPVLPSSARSSSRTSLVRQSVENSSRYSRVSVTLLVIRSFSESTNMAANLLREII